VLAFESFDSVGIVNTAVAAQVGFSGESSPAFWTWIGALLDGEVDG
jgi:hypothetical protein